MAFAPFAGTYTAEPRRPSGGPQPGAVALLDWLCDESPWADEFTSLGIYSPRDICGNFWPDWRCTGSQHARGAAGDAGCRVVRPGGLVEGWEAANWLVRNAAILGVQEVIFAGQRWDNQTRRWKVYTGRSDHYDHVHFALNASGARYLTRARILSVAPGAPAPAPTPIPPLEDDVFFYDMDHPKDPTGPDALIQVTAKGQVRLTGQDVAVKARANPNYLGKAGDDMVARWKSEHGPIAFL